VAPLALGACGVTWWCAARRAFRSPRTGLIVLTEQAVYAGVYAGVDAARWFAGYDQGELDVWEGWQ
jgi:hypothetical protein